MMTIDEILKAKGISDETIAAVLEEMKTNKIFTASEENLDIRYGKLKTQHDSVAKQLAEANGTIEELKKSNKGNDDLQQKVTAYEQRMTQLQAELEETKIDAAAKVGLLAAKAVDTDYLLFKLKEQAKKDGKALELDEAGEIKGWADKLESLKTQAPKMFESGTDGEGGYQVFKPDGLKKGDGGENTPTKERFKAMSYEERLALKQKNETLYKQLAN